MTNSENSVFVAGHKGLLGSALVRALQRRGVAPRINDFGADLSDPVKAEALFSGCQTVYMAAGVGGGIKKNIDGGADLAYKTMRLLSGVIEGARRARVDQFIWFPCACIYPESLAPWKETNLWRGEPESTSRAFAAAQLAGLEFMRSIPESFALALVLPTLYGPGDDFSDEGHVLAGVMRRVDQAKRRGEASVTLWGWGRAIRQFLYVEDAAEAAVASTTAWQERYGKIVNVAGESGLTLRELAAAIATVVGYGGEIIWDGTFSGARWKEMIGLAPPRVTPLEEGLQKTYAWYAKQSAPVGRLGESA